MREIGRPLDLALHRQRREFEEATTRERKLQRELERKSRVGGRASNRMCPQLMRGDGALAELQVAVMWTMTVEMETNKKLWAQFSWITTAKKKAIQNGLGG